LTNVEIENYCCRDELGNCVPGDQDSDGSCLVTPLAGTFASIEGPPVVVPLWHLRRSAEIHLHADAVERFVADCAEAGEVMGDKIAITRDCWNKLAEKWRPRMRRHRSSNAIETMPCNGCGGGNAVQDVATARTPEAMEQAIINA